MILLLVLAALPDASVPTALPISLDRRTRELMHTEVTVAIPDGVAPAIREAAFVEAFGVFEDIERDLNEWREGSALARINASAGKEAVVVAAPVCEVVRTSLDGAKRTRGLFDPTWAALRGIWRFGPGDAAVPSLPEVAKQCAAVGWRGVEVSASRPDGSCAVRLERPGMALGLGGLVKGWGVDQVVKKLRARGLRDFFVQAGGDLYVAGKNGDRPWRVGIRNPRGDKDSSFARLELSDSAFSTSGDYEHFFVSGGVRYHHLIDPRTCWPATASASTTVMAKSATDAEFLTKAAFILGPKEGQALVREFGAGAVWVTPDGAVHVTEGLEQHLEVWPLVGFDAGVK